MSDEEARQQYALGTAVVFLIAVLLIFFVIFGYKHCEARDARIQDCLDNGHHTAEECERAYR